MPEVQQNNEQTKQLFIDRLASYQAGCMLILGSGDDQKKEKIDSLLAKYKSESFELDQYNAAAKNFIKEAAVIICVKEKEIALAEAYHAWSVNKPQIVTKPEVSGIPEQVTITEETCRYNLTQAQQTFLKQIKETTSPKWVKKLKAWEKKFLLEHIDSIYTDSSLPATLRKLPGIANAAKITNEFKDTQFTCYRMGVPTAYKLSADGQSSANENVKQMLDGIKPDVVNNFKAFWGGDLSITDIPPPVLCLGLLTLRSQGNPIQVILDTTGLSGVENNNTLSKQKTAAVNQYSAVQHNKDLDVIDLNIGLLGGWQGRGWIASGVYVGGFLDKIKATQGRLKANLASSAPDKLNKLDQAITALESHTNTWHLPFGSRNKNLFTAALCHVIVERAGGTAVVNCKSGKDRTGIEIMMAQAMNIYFEAKGELPKFDDTGAARSQFVNIFADLFKSEHHQQSAALNSPGSCGLKDEGILDQDILTALGDYYKEQKIMAALNKPGSFYEKHQSKTKWIYAISLAIGIALIATGLLAPVGIVWLGVTIGLGVAIPAIIIAKGRSLSSDSNAKSKEIETILSAVSLQQDSVVAKGRSLSSDSNAKSKEIETILSAESLQQDSVVRIIDKLGGVAVSVVGAQKDAAAESSVVAVPVDHESKSESDITNSSFNL